MAVIRNLVEEAAEKLRLAKMSDRQFGLMVRIGEERSKVYNQKIF